MVAAYDISDLKRSYFYDDAIEEKFDAVTSLLLFVFLGVLGYCKRRRIVNDRN